ncbi:hypothetical protein CC2G_011722 [Coprinopsis cinerea AmutBmut pab1-1]|nr:hypothetical protein CC2G_011722 [Coprinopsis cinerea AmutBmut pab1-1]
MGSPYSDSKIEAIEKDDTGRPWDVGRAMIEDAKDNMATESLETAISLLRQVMRNEDDGTSRAIAERGLVKALLTRFAHRGWFDDMYECDQLLDKCEQEQIELLPRRVGDKAALEVYPDSIHQALDLIASCRRSIDTEKLETAIQASQDALSSPSPEVSDFQRADLVLRVGNALVLTYLASGSAGSLDRAAGCFQEARGLCNNKDPLKLNALLGLQLVGMIKFTECEQQRKAEGLDEKTHFRRAVAAEDGKGLDAFILGSRLIHGPQLEKGISLLRLSLELRPPLHPLRHHSLNNLGDALTIRFKYTGNIEDLNESIALSQEALSLTPPPHPGRPTTLIGLANGFLTRFKRAGDIHNLEASISHYREALSLQPEGHPGRILSLKNLGTSLSILFRHQGGVEILEECIAYRRETLALRPEGHPARPDALDDLSVSLALRFQLTGNFQDLDNSISYGQEAFLHRPRGHPHRSSSLTNLANSVLLRYQSKSSFEDLEKCIGYHRESLLLSPKGHPDRSLSLSNLAESLRIRFMERGQIEDLEECVRCNQEALALRPSGHPKRPSSLDSLGTSLLERFRHKGDHDDLEKSILYGQEALTLKPKGHVDRFSPLSNLASALATRFQHKGKRTDLEESITYEQEALASMPTGHPRRYEVLHNLANSISTRFEHEGIFNDLDDVVRYRREALESLSASRHTARSQLLDSLASSLSIRFKHSGNSSDLEECIVYHRAALSLRPTGHPERSSSLSNLAVSLSNRFQHKGDFQDLEECVTCHREALALRSEGHSEYSESLNCLANALSLRFEYTRDIRDIEESIRYFREASGFYPDKHPFHPACVNNLANALTTRFKNKQDVGDLEESITSLRTVLKSIGDIHPFRPLLLSTLGLAARQRFDVLHNVDDLQEAISSNEQALSAIPDNHPNHMILTHNLAGAMLRKYETTKATDDLDRVFSLFETASRSKTGPLLAQLKNAIGCATCGRQFHRPNTAFQAYRHAMSLFPLLASLDMTLQQRQSVLLHTRGLVRDAAQYAIEQEVPELAVTFLSSGRSVFWSQALQTRVTFDRLEGSHPLFASELRSVTRRLEAATHQLLQDVGGFEKATVSFSSSLPHTLAEERDKLLRKIREIPEFRDFLLPPTFDSLKLASKNGPLVFLNESRYGCHALILQRSGALHSLALSVDAKQVVAWRNAIDRLAGGHVIPAESLKAVEGSTERALLGRSSRRTSDDDFRILLQVLWTQVVQPVVQALDLKKVDSPSERIWWCPAGLFSFLPIHASGLYSKQNHALDCLFHYAISSYCSSPQDLLSPPPAPIFDFQMLAIIEPETLGPGVSSLPSTLVELEKIKSRIPRMEQLVTRVSSKDEATTPDTVLGDIAKSSIVHFGCHGTQNPGNPLESRLLLKGGEIMMSTIINKCQSSTAALAYLSACETAMGDDARPDESLSLAATMMFAGFRSVVGTMWAIHDEDGPIVADVFYSHLFRHGAGSPPNVTDAAYGLHLATRELREQGVSFHRWVPFVHFGL